MFCTPLLVVAVSQLPIEGAGAVKVVVQADTLSIVAGTPLLLKTTAANRSSTNLPFRPPQDALFGTLLFECNPPGETEYRPIRITTMEPSRFAPRPNWEPGAAHVSYNWLYRQQVSSGYIRPHRRVRDTQYVASTEGTWRIRAAVVAGGVKYWSSPISIEVKPATSREVASSLEICADSLSRWIRLPTSTVDEADIAFVQGHLPTLGGTPAGNALQQVVLLNRVRTATADELVERLADLRNFSDTCPPIHQEYLKLMLGFAYVQRKDFTSAKVVADQISEPSALRQYLVRAINRKE